MNLNPQLFKKTKQYLLKVIFTGVLVLSIGIAGGGQTLQAAADGLAQENSDFAMIPFLVDPPSNDSFLTPTPIVLDENNQFTRTLDTTAATAGLTDPTSILLGDCNSNKGEASVWYRYSPTADISLHVDTIGSNYDTLLAVWAGSADEIDPGNLTLVSCNDDVGTYEIWSKVGFTAQSGTTYYIEVISYDGPAVGALAGPGGMLKFHVESSTGPDTTGVFRPSNGKIYLKNANTTGYADIAIHYGVAGDYPVTGDWDGDGDDTIGVYRNGIFYLRNSNTVGVADITFAFGAPGDQPVVGDWNEDGIDTVGVYRSSKIAFYLRNSNSAGTADMLFKLGYPGDIGIAGDWNGDGIDTTGVFRPSNGKIYLKNANTTGVADLSFVYGVAGDKPVAGDWNDDGIDTIGIYRNAKFYLRNSNSVGYADLVFALGVPGDLPIIGNWDGMP